METRPGISLIDVIIPLTIVLFIIAVGVVMLYTQFQRNLYRQELDKAALRSAQQEELLRNSIYVQEEERKRIASDLHDELGAVISIIRMNLVLMGQGLRKTETVAPEMVSAVEKLIDLSDSGISSVRNISHQLMPPQLESFGLVKTLESFIDTINVSGKVSICLAVEKEPPTLPWPFALGLYRIIMELINNTIKHSGAKNIKMRFDREDDKLLFYFQDDGKGLDMTDPVATGMGFKNMEARAAALNGSIGYGNNPGNTGFRALIKLPVE